MVENLTFWYGLRGGKMKCDGICLFVVPAGRARACLCARANLVATQVGNLGKMFVLIWHRPRRSVCLASTHVQFPEARLPLRNDVRNSSRSTRVAANTMSVVFFTYHMSDLFQAEHISSSAGFYSFPRACTGRADLQPGD